MKKRKRISGFSNKVFLSLLVLFAQNEIVSAKSCFASIPTLQSVKECPKTQQEWNERSAIKRCDMLAGTSQCSSFAYHCLLNQDGNGTVEVCAPTWYLSGFCAIYNTDEFRVIDNFNFDCNNNTKILKEDRCPSRYISTETYKYQICYRKREQKTPDSDRIYQSNMEDGNSISIWTIVFIVLFILTLIASIFQAVLLYRVGCDKLRKNGQTFENHKPRQGDSSHDENQGNTQQNRFEGDDGGNEKDPLLEGNTRQNRFEGDDGGNEKDPLVEVSVDMTQPGYSKKEESSTRDMTQLEYSKKEKSSTREKTTKTNQKAKNDHDKAKVEREEERKGVEDKRHVQRNIKIFEPKTVAENQGKDTKENVEVVPGQPKETGISGQSLQRERSADSNIHGGVEQIVEDKSGGLTCSTEEKQNNVPSAEGTNKLAKVQEEEGEEEEEKEDEEEEKEHTKAKSTNMKNQPYPIPDNTAIEKEMEQDEDEMNKGTYTDTREDNTDSMKVNSNKPSVESCTS